MFCKHFPSRSDVYSRHLSTLNWKEVATVYVCGRFSIYSQTCSKDHLHIKTTCL